LLFILFEIVYETEISFQFHHLLIFLSDIFSLHFFIDIYLFIEIIYGFNFVFQFLSSFNFLTIRFGTYSFNNFLKNINKLFLKEITFKKEKKNFPTHKQS